MVTVVFDPAGSALQRVGLQLAGPPLRFAPPHDESGALQYFQVLGNGRQAHVERRGQLTDGSLAERNPGKDGPPRGVGQRCEGGAQGIRHGYLTDQLFNRSVNYATAGAMASSTSAHLHETAHRPRGRGRAVLDSELYEHLLEMFVHRSWADGQNLPDLAIGLAATDPQQHLSFPRRQLETSLQQLPVSGFAHFREAEQQLVRA